YPRWLVRGTVLQAAVQRGHVRSAQPTAGRSDGRPSAEEMLDRVRRQAGSGARGRHRVYLGIAPGVGKTYTSLEELHRRHQRGTDVVIGFLETHRRPRTLEVAGDLEVVPRKQIPYKGVTVE